MNDRNPFRSFDLTPPPRPPDPGAARGVMRFFVEYNPFYLLSAMCMLAGLFALNNSLTWSPLPQHNLLWLILILNTYEFLLVTLGIFLWRRGLTRDAATLFILEAFFLVDAGFLNSEVFTANFELGLWVNAALIFLACVKVAAVFVGSGVSLSDGRFALIVTQMFMLLAVPGLFKFVAIQHEGRLPVPTLYSVWWAVGLIPVFYLILMHGRGELEHRGILGTFVLLPIISILAHLCTSNWVYHVRWYHANLSPLLLGLAVAIGASERHVTSISARMRTQLIMPVLAIILSSTYPLTLAFPAGEFNGDDVMITPMRLTLLAAVLVYLHGLLVHRHPYFAVAGAACLTAAGLGESPEAIARNVTSAGDKTGKSVWRLVPTSVTAWGIISVIASFLLLAIGTAVSLLKQTRTQVPEEAVLAAEKTNECA